MDDDAALPKVLVIKPPSVFVHHTTSFTRYFNFLKAYESPLQLHDFLAAANSAGVSAMLITGNGPPINASFLDHIPSIRCMVSSAAGVDYVDLDECRRRGIQVANAANVSAVDCADFAVGLLIDVCRKVSLGDRFVKGGGGWTDGEFPLGRRLAGKTVGIVGLGSIGSKVAKRLNAFDCRILYHSREKKPSVPYQFYSDVCKLAADSNFLIICCSLSHQTRHLINKEVLIALGKDGIIVNIARGPIIDEKELVMLLLEGLIAGAGLDVFEREPDVPKELFSLNNVVLAHHQASFTEGCFHDVFELIKGNFDAFFSNKPLLTPVL